MVVLGSNIEAVRVVKRDASRKFVVSSIYVLLIRFAKLTRWIWQIDTKLARVEEAASFFKRSKP